jgi:hypothetical protein
MVVPKRAASSALSYIAMLAACSTGRPVAVPAIDNQTGALLSASDTACSTTSPDLDNDGLSDSCELSLAQAFAPQLVVAGSGCNFDTSVSPSRLGGEYYFGVQRSGDNVRIAYLPAYYRDCGWRGAKCWLPFVDCAPHAGDSELIIIDVGRDDRTQRWRTNAIFLSAHCFGRSDGDCRWYRASELSEFDWVAGAPVVWVAEGRQANYANASACDRGHSFIDTCDQNFVRYRFPIQSQSQNIGSRTHPAGANDGCVGPDHIGWKSIMTVAGSIECLWSRARPFRGWQSSAMRGAATPYGRYLDEIASF